MRYLFIAMLVGGVTVGCVAPRVVVPPPVSEEVEDWRQRYLEACEREEALAVRLAALEGVLEVRAQERADATRLNHVLVGELRRGAAERQALSEHNAHLMSRQREQAALQEELEDVWYQSALQRARRSSQSEPEPVRPVTVGPP